MHTTYLLTCGSEGRDRCGPAVGRREAHRLGLLQEDARPLAIASAGGVTGAGLEVDTQRGARLDLAPADPRSAAAAARARDQHLGLG